MSVPPGYVMVFNDEFDGPLDVSEWGPGTKWIAHTPYNGDFGYAKFGIGDGQHMYTSGGNLVIKWTGDIVDNTKNPPAWKFPGGTTGGLISSAARDGSGFALAMGYWECRAKFAPPIGTWPAFWLNSIAGIPQPRRVTVAEIDIVEFYGNHLTWMWSNCIRWGVGGPISGGSGQQMLETGADLTTDFHVYGCLIDSDHIYFYFDGSLIFTATTFPEAMQPLYVMLDFATNKESLVIGNFPNPNYVYFDYVRAYSPPIGAGTSFFPSLYLDTQDQLGPVANIVPNVTPLNATGSRQGDQLGIYKNLINNAITLETIAGVTHSVDPTSHEYKMRRGLWRQWCAYDAMPTSGTSGLFVLSNATVCLAFPATTVTTVRFIGMVPWDTVLDDGAIIRIRWSSSVTSGNAIFGAALEKQCVTDVTSDSFDTAVTASVAAPGTANTIQTTSITQTHLDGLTLGDAFRLRIQRLDNDTLAGTVNVYMITIEGAT